MENNLILVELNAGESHIKVLTPLPDGMTVEQFEKWTLESNDWIIGILEASFTNFKVTPVNK